MPKLPWFPFYPRDWLGDPELSMCAEATRGIWIDALAAMHEQSRSWYLTGTVAQLARVCRTTPDALAAAVADLHTTGAADVHKHSDGTITLTSRRFKREAETRRNGSARVAKHRQKQQVTARAAESNAGVTDRRQKAEIRTQRESKAEEREARAPAPGPEPPLEEQPGAHPTRPRHAYREADAPVSGLPPGSGVPWPTKFQPDEESKRYALAHGLDPAEVREKLRNYAEARGLPRVNWQSAYREQVDFLAAKGGGARGARPAQPQSPPPDQPQKHGPVNTLRDRLARAAEKKRDGGGGR